MTGFLTLLARRCREAAAERRDYERRHTETVTNENGLSGRATTPEGVMAGRQARTLDAIAGLAEGKEL